MKTQIISAVLLLISGFLITGSGAYFSVKGFTMFIPDETIFIGLLVLAVAFEVAKITASTFLFHKSGDSRYPTWMKFVLSLCVVVLILMSDIFTFSHLNVSVAKSMAQVEAIDRGKERQTTEHQRLVDAIAKVDKQIESVPDNASVNQRLRMKNAYNEEKTQLRQKLDKMETEITASEKESIDNDRFLFLNSISKLMHVGKETMFTIVVLTVTFIIDPLAISLIVFGTAVLTDAFRKRNEKLIPLSEVEFDPVETITEPVVEVEMVQITPEPVRDAGDAWSKADLDAVIATIVHKPVIDDTETFEAVSAMVTAEVEHTKNEEAPEPIEEPVIEPDPVVEADPEAESLEEAELRAELTADVSIQATPTTPTAKLARKHLQVTNYKVKDNEDAAE
jgi:hypothetical protein